ncbi:MAG: CRISPR system precrRNA processing endoribonuclease RAMP protein Cas6 [bacterium]
MFTLPALKIASYEITLEVGPLGLNLPAFKGSTLRGAFGSTFRRLTCARHNEENCKDCLVKENCPYARVFESAPPEGSTALTKYESIPRPFVFEPPLEDRTQYDPGEKLTFGLVLIGHGIDYLPYFILAFRELGSLGLGKGRHPYSLKEVRAIDPLTGEVQQIYTDEQNRVLNHANFLVDTLSILDSCSNKNPTILSLHFLTMTRLKYKNQWTKTLHFHILVRNLLRRVSSLAYFYHGIEWDEDFPSIINQAAEVRIYEDRSLWSQWQRYSSRQNQKISLGGVIGEVTYTGSLKPFLPLLQLGSLVHVGKAATFGMGKYRLKQTTELG